MFLFKLPNVIWVLLHAYGGLSLSGLVKSVAEINEIDPKDRENVISNLGSQIDRWLEVQKLYKRNSCINAISAISRYFVCLCNKRNGTFLTGLYLFTKLVYAGSVIGQFFVLNAFMATNYTMYGYEVLNSLLSKRPWRDSPRFPTVTFCDFEIRQLQNVQTFTVQCVLPANLFNEKVFIFMWFWLSLVTLVSVFSLLKWLYISTYKPSNLRYVKKYRTIVGKFPLRTERRLFKRFVHQYLRDDGVFVLRMLARNTTDIVIALLIDNLWQNYVGQQKRQLKNGSWSKNETNQLASD
ncbi:hypothetical protein DPMN_011095 [Dreissena polymorpha]|uniref:Innexin n=2 Tax=Dreissena polymorpha TaxID=45954 RepID=A0A9D4N3E2_DREPO|nr:hypothetical protein DPMN_011095 [Dreissena polymorpha]